MPSYSLQGNFTIPSNTNYTPPKSNWASNGSSNDSSNIADYTLMTTSGAFTVPTDALYTIMFTCNTSDLMYSGTGSISVLYTPINGNPFKLGTFSVSSTFQHTMNFSAGDTLTPLYNLASSLTVNLLFPSVTNSFQITFATPYHTYIYYASPSVPPLINQQPRQLHVIGVLTSGFQIVIPITLDATPTGAALFVTILSVTATPMAGTQTTNIGNMPLCSIDPLPSNNKTVTVNVAVPNTIVVGGTAVKNAPAGTSVFVVVTGW